MIDESRVYNRIQRYGKTKAFKIESKHDESAVVVNNFNSLSGLCNNLIDTISQVEAAKSKRDGDALDKALDTLKDQMQEFSSIGKITKATMLSYLKPLVKG